MAIETAATLLERDRELTSIAHALSEAQQGRGSIVLVEGPAGVGKTSLLRVSSQTAADEGFLCLRARAIDLERDFAYGCVRQLLEPVAAKPSGPELAGLFEGAAALAKPLFAPTGAVQPAPSADNTFAVLHGLYWLLNNLAESSPVVLSIDDLHWADTESLLFLNYLAPRLDGLTILVLASMREGESDGPDLARLATGPDTTVLRPEPLSVAATATLCKQRLGEPVADEFAAACHDATRGNPFFLEALLREAREQKFPTDARAATRIRRMGPAAVAKAVLLRISEAPASATALVRAAAVLGDGASLAEAARLAGLAEEEAAAAADRLTALSILTASERLEFAHPIVREAVYGDIGARERAEAHARAAVALAASNASEDRIAAQLVKAQPIGDPERVELLRRVAADALTRGAPAAAVAWLDRARMEPPPPGTQGEVLIELSSASLRLGKPEVAIELLTAAGERIEEPKLVAMSARLLANALAWSGDADRAVDVIGSAIDAVESNDRELALLLEAERAAYAQLARLDTRAAEAVRLECFSDLEGATPGERLVLANLAFGRARASESAEKAAACIEHVLADTRLLGEQELDVAGTLYLLVGGLIGADALDLAEACLERMLSDARARASIPAQAFVIEHRAWVSLRRGLLPQAESDARTALELLTTHDIHLGVRLALSVLIKALIEGGDVEAAERALRTSGLGDEIPPGMPNNDLLEARGLLRVAQGRMGEGLDDLQEFGHRDELWGQANRLASRWRSRACFALGATGESDAAHRMAADDLERARRWGSPSGMGAALCAVALMEGGAAAVDRLREATAVLELSPARLEHARVLVELGAALRRANRRAEARGVLQEGLDLADRCAAHALAERARIELRAAGGRSHATPATGTQQLTASERRVAELAADGLSNPEIAQALFVTRKTVETHLGAVYRKLAISGRGKLARALADTTSNADGD